MADFEKVYEKLSREDLEKEDKDLAKQRTEIRERQVVVTRLLDAHRELDRLNLPPETIKQMYRMAEIRAASQTDTEKSEDLG